MNELNLTIKNGIGDVKMITSQDMLDKFLELFDMEIELLQGTHKHEGDYHHCVFQLTGYKLDMMQDFIRELARHPKIQVTIMGVKVNNN